MPYKQSDIICIFGRRGFGKSYFARAVVSQYNRYIIYDINGEHRDLGIVIRSPRALAEYLLDKSEADTFKIIYIPMYKDFDYITYLLWGLENFCFMIDEVDRFTGSRKIPEHLDLMINLGRHYKLGLITCSRRPARVPRDLTSQADYIVSFQSQEPNDIKYLNDFIGPRAELLPGLDKREHIIYNDNCVKLINTQGKQKFL